jgi:hypothetical protein
MKKTALYLLTLLCACSHNPIKENNIPAQEPQVSTQETQTGGNLVVITLDGLRWQELFSGVDTTLMNNPEYTKHSWSVRQKYWAATANERRRKLFPFLWSTVESLGQIHGNRDLGSKVDVMNAYRFSYPGYNEMFTGFPQDTTGKSNSIQYPNKNTSVLEFMNNLPAYKDKVAVFASWDVFHAIYADKRSKIFVNAGYESIPFKSPVFDLLNNMQWKEQDASTSFSQRGDMYTYYLAREYMKEFKPKIVHIAFIETDNFGHEGNYENVLHAAHIADAWMADLWKMLQSMPEYKDNTTLLFLTDHGRGNKITEQWKEHDSTIAGSNEIWFAAMGPGIHPLGEIKKQEQLYQAQIAQTIANLLGFTFTSEHPVRGAVKGL